VPIAAFLNIYSRLLVEGENGSAALSIRDARPALKPRSRVRPLAFSGFDLTYLLQSDYGKPADISSIAWRI
jgi:hypothetical protein